jgi:hypothetical protein
MSGLYIQNPLIENLEKYLMPRHMKNMLGEFQETLSLPDLLASVYSDILEVEEKFI